MPTRKVKVGFEGKIYYGVAGAEATNLLENTRDINYNLDIDLANTTVRGDGSAVPIETEDVVCLKAQIEWDMLNDIDDPHFEALSEAAATGDPVAIRTKRHSTGKGFDGDCVISIKESDPLKGEEVTTFTAKPTRSYGRSPQLRV